MKLEMFVGAIGPIFVGSQVECLYGDFMGSIAESIDGHRDSGRNRWRPDGITAAAKTSSSGSPDLAVRGKPKVSKDHSRSRYGNQRS